MVLTHHHRVQLVHEGDEHRRRHDDQEKVRKQEVRRPERHLHDLDEEFTSRLRERGRAEPTPVPFAGPPSAVSLFVLQLTRKEDRNEDLLDGTLNGDDGDDTKYRMGGIPELQEPLHSASESTA